MEEYDPADNSERDTKLLFIKTFLKSDGSRLVNFESVTVKKDGKEVSISSHEVNTEDLIKKMHNDKVVHLNDLFFSSEGHLTEPQAEGPDLVPTPNSSDNKTTTSEPQKQEVEQKNVAETEIPLIGRSLTDEEANAVISRMEENAAVAPELELTPENWDGQFGEDGIVGTPIGDVKMGENQYLKMSRQGREGKLGMVKPTLETPDIIVEEKSSAGDGAVTERNSSFVFLKAFKNEDGSRMYKFASVTVRKGGREVVISNQEKETPRIKRLLKEGMLTYISDATLPFESTASTQGVQPTIPGGATLSDNKTTTFEPQKQEVAQKKVAISEILRLKNGDPDYNAMTPEMFVEQYVEHFGADATEAIAHNNIKDADKKINSINREINSLTDPNKLPKLKQKLDAEVSRKDRYVAILDLLGFSENRVQLESDSHKASVRLTWNDQKKKWLLTAFEKKEASASIGKTTDTDDNPSDLQGDTALLQNTDALSDNKNTISKPNNQGFVQKNVEDFGLIDDEELSIDEDAPFAIENDEIPSGDSASELAAEAAVMALKQSGVEVVEATPEMVDEALRRRDALLKIKKALKTAEQPKTTIPTAISSASGAKILKNLENEAKKYEEKPSNRSRTFIGDVAKALDISKSSGKSRYKTFETANGKIVTIRLSNHNATVANFDALNERYGISIVVTGEANNGINNSQDGKAHIVEFFYSEKDLRKAYGRPLAQIIRSIQQSLFSGVYEDTTGLAEIEQESVRFYKTLSNGVVVVVEKEQKKQPN